MNKFLSLLKQFVSIRSVSADLGYSTDIQKAALWLKRYAISSGFEVEIVKGFDNPIIIARTPYQKSLQTILVYGHYDVQPASKEDGWKTDPFIITKSRGRLFARGSADNKGQILMHLYTVGELLKANRLGFNVTFLIEGNEETGSPNLEKFLKRYRTKLACDCIIISDGELAHNNQPALEASFRGVANIEIRLRTAIDDVHSGIFGGIMPNAARELSSLLAQLHDKDGLITIPGFYENASVMLSSVKVAIKKWEREVLELIGSKKVFARNDKEFEHRSGLHPALEITTFTSGYLGQGFRNSIPAAAIAKINIRSAPNQNPNVLAKRLRRFLNAKKGRYVDLDIIVHEATKGATLDTAHMFADRARKILKKVYGREPVLKHSGGTLPIVNHFEEILGVSQLMVPLANTDCGMHSASENISLTAIQKGLEFSKLFFRKSE